jgi:hypothetical protein
MARSPAPSVLLAVIAIRIPGDQEIHERRPRYGWPYRRESVVILAKRDFQIVLSLFHCRVRDRQAVQARASTSAARRFAISS